MVFSLEHFEFGAGWSCLGHCKMAHKFQDHLTSYCLHRLTDLEVLRGTIGWKWTLSPTKNSTSCIEAWFHFIHKILEPGPAVCTHSLQTASVFDVFGVSFHQLPHRLWRKILLCLPYRANKLRFTSHVIGCSQRLIFSYDFSHRTRVAALHRLLLRWGFFAR